MLLSCLSSWLFLSLLHLPPLPTFCLKLFKIKKKEYFCNVMYLSSKYSSKVPGGLWRHLSIAAKKGPCQSAPCRTMMLCSPVGWLMRVWAPLTDPQQLGLWAQAWAEPLPVLTSGYEVPLQCANNSCGVWMSGTDCYLNQKNFVFIRPSSQN